MQWCAGLGEGIEGEKALLPARVIEWDSAPWSQSSDPAPRARGTSPGPITLLHSTLDLYGPFWGLNIMLMTATTEWTGMAAISEAGNGQEWTHALINALHDA